MLALRMPLDVRRNLMLPPGVVLQARTCRRLRIRRRDSQTTENSSAPEPASRLQGHFERGLREDSCSKRRAEAGSPAKRPRRDENGGDEERARCTDRASNSVHDGPESTPFAWTLDRA